MLHQKIDQFILFVLTQEDLNLLAWHDFVLISNDPLVSLGVENENIES